MEKFERSLELILKKRYKQKVLAKQPILFDTKVLLTIAYDIIKALEYLHNLNLLHADLKPANVLTRGNKIEPTSCHVTDFGTVTSIRVLSQFQSIGTPRFQAPEVKNGEFTRNDGLKPDSILLNFSIHYKQNIFNSKSIAMVLQ